MFFSHLTFALELIALAFGVSLFIWSLRHDGAGIVLGKIAGIIIISLAVLDILCSSYNAIRYQALQDEFRDPVVFGSMQRTPFPVFELNSRDTMNATGQGKSCSMCESMKRNNMPQAVQPAQGMQSGMIQ